MLPFKCPQCGGPYFGRDTNINDKGVIVPADTVRCHSAEDGGNLMYHDNNLDMWRPRPVKPCGWRGVWPPKESEATSE